MVLLDDEVLASAHLSEEDIRLELAIALYQRGRLTQRQSSQLAQLSLERFEAILEERNIYHPFTETDLAHDIQTLKIIRANRDSSQ